MFCSQTPSSIHFKVFTWSQISDLTTLSPPLILFRRSHLHFVLGAGGGGGGGGGSTGTGGPFPTFLMTFGPRPSFEVSTSIEVGAGGSLKTKVKGKFYKEESIAERMATTTAINRKGCSK